jgi:hypothetical protein
VISEHHYRSCSSYEFRLQVTLKYFCHERVISLLKDKYYITSLFISCLIFLPSLSPDCPERRLCRWTHSSTFYMTGSEEWRLVFLWWGHNGIAATSRTYMLSACQCSLRVCRSTMASLLKLRTGASMPAIGFGTWQVSVVISSLLHTVEAGSGVHTAHYRTHTECS